MSDKTELLPCPFCGGRADTKCTEGDYPDWFAQCEECGASVDITGPYDLHFWNTRAAPAEDVRAVVDEPYGYLRELDGNCQLSIGPIRPPDRASGHATPWCAIYSHPQRPVVMPERREINANGRLYLSDLDCEWNACLDEFARLNPQ